MKHAFGLSIPDQLADTCTPSKCALLIYDMEVGIVPQISEGATIVAQCRRLLEAARDKGFRVFFLRHFFLPNQLAGVGQLRRSMTWQGLDDPLKIRPMMTQGSPACQIVPELAPREDEVVIDKITMSAFEGTFLNIAMRDAHLESFVVAGIALEIGIEPTVRQSLDLNYLPIVVTDACGSKTPELKERSLATLKDTGEILTFTTAEVISAMQR
jgi:nicotinamidase-related amidase